MATGTLRVQNFSFNKHFLSLSLSFIDCFCVYTYLPVRLYNYVSANLYNNQFSIYLIYLPICPPYNNIFDLFN
jgi:hypothetical protein